MSEAQVGDIICNASGRGTKCVHKRNAILAPFGVKITICAIKADSKMCAKAGHIIEAPPKELIE